MILTINNKPIEESVVNKLNTQEDYSKCHSVMEAAIQAQYEYEENWRRFDKHFSENNIILDDNHIGFLMENGIVIQYEAEEVKKVSGSIAAILKSWGNKVKAILNKFSDELVKILDIRNKITKLEASVEEIKWPEGKVIKSRNLNAVKSFYPKLITEEISKKGLKSIAKWDGSKWVIDESIIKRHVKEWSGKDQETCSLVDIVNHQIGNNTQDININGSTKGYSYKEARDILFKSGEEGVYLTNIEKALDDYTINIEKQLSELYTTSDDDKKNSAEYGVGLPKIKGLLKTVGRLDMDAISAACDIWIGKFMLNKQVCLAYLSGPKKKKEQQ